MKILSTINCRSHQTLQLSYRFCLHMSSFRNFKSSLIQIYLRTYSIFSEIQSTSNQEVINYKVVDLIELYKFYIKFIFIRLRMKKLDKKHIYKIRYLIDTGFNRKLAPTDSQVLIFIRNRHICDVHICRFKIKNSTYSTELIGAGLSQEPTLMIWGTIGVGFCYQPIQ